MIRKEITIINKLGLHARAAARLVKLASQFNSNIDIERSGKRVNGKSIMGVLLLAAAKNSHIIVHIEGDDEDDAYDAIEKLINERFYEDE